MSGPSGYSLSEQIACVEREVRMREKLYPVWILKNKMTQAVADRQINCMRQVLRTLQAMINGRENSSSES